MTPIEWLSERWELDLPFEDAPNRPTVPPNADGSPLTRLQIFAALVRINHGRFGVRGYGVVRMGSGTYGRIGLDKDEADSLVELEGILQGMCIALGTTPEDLAASIHPAIMAEWLRVETARGTQQPVGSG